ncbi:MAG: hypothetical protein M3Y53_02260 [Thermoproteota archaeon]|nr:hypothetical protein [Thermoproteota archaeon]
MIISTRKEYLSLLPPVSEAEYESWKQSIASEHGLIVPIIVNKHGIVLDGHNRFRACKELGIPLQYQIKEFDDPLEEKKFVIETNLNRRHLNEFQKAELGYLLEGIEGELAKRRQEDSQFKPGHPRFGGRGSKGSLWSSSREDRHKPASPISHIIAKKIGISHATYERSRKIIIKGSEDQKNALRKGVVRIKKIYRQVRREEKEAELIEKAKLGPPNAQPLHNNQLKQSGNPNVQLYHSDFRLLTEEQIPSESVDLIFTHPPDDADSLPLYQDLARFANRCLKEGASLVTYAGQWAMPTIFDYMRSNNLQYWWTMSVKHTGGSARMHKYKVRVRWKPLLWFVKGPVGTRPTSMINDIHDFIVSKLPEDNRLGHERERSTAEASYIIENLSVEHQLVVDTFLGRYGSTGVAAVKLNRRFIGSEIYHDYYTTAADRISRTKTTAGDRSR